MSSNQKEAIKTDSKVSAMRIAFFWMIKYIIILSAVVGIAAIVFAWVGKPFPLGEFIGLIGVLGTVAFGGKAAQSFSEGSFMPTSFGQYNYNQGYTTPLAQAQIKVSGSAEEPNKQ